MSAQPKYFDTWIENVTFDPERRAMSFEVFFSRISPEPGIKFNWYSSRYWLRRWSGLIVDWNGNTVGEMTGSLEEVAWSRNRGECIICDGAFWQELQRRPRALRAGLWGSPIYSTNTKYGNQQVEVVISELVLYLKEREVSDERVFQSAMHNDRRLEAA